jgi:hypothetical protein
MTPTREQVCKLAREADIIDWRDEDGDQHVEQMIDSLMVIWRAARAQALEDAISDVRKTAQSWPTDGLIRPAILEAARRLKALKGKQ